MTPSAITPAARRAAKGTTAAPGHRRTLRPKGIARRVSGPAGGRAAAPAAPARTAAPTRTRTASAAVRPRRISAGRSRTRSDLPLARRAAQFVRTLPDHALLDRIVRGRAWIPLLGVMLAGIVAMQVEVLKLGASMGRAIERSSLLQSRNEQLRESVAALADDQRIERLANGFGMVMPAPGTVGFLSPRGNQASQAAANVKSPDATAFLAQLSLSDAAAAPVAPAATSTTAPAVTSPTQQTAPTTATSTTGGTPTGAATTVGTAIGPAGTTGTGSTSATTGAGGAPATGVGGAAAAGTVTTASAASTGGAGLSTGG